MRIPELAQNYARLRKVVIERKIELLTSVHRMIINQNTPHNASTMAELEFQERINTLLPIQINPQSIQADAAYEMLCEVDEYSMPLSDGTCENVLKKIDPLTASTADDYPMDPFYPSFTYSGG